jgi:hypothetical protein
MPPFLGEGKACVGLLALLLLILMQQYKSISNTMKVTPAAPTTAYNHMLSTEKKKCKY